MRRKYTAAERRLQDIQILQAAAVKVAHIEGIRARVRAGSDGRVAPASHNPIHFVRPVKGYRLPTLFQWKEWLWSRIGTFLMHNVSHTLCISCGFPIPVSSGDKTVLGVHGKKTVEAGKGSKVTVGALVKWTEETVSVYGVYNPLTPTVTEIEDEKVVRLVTANGLACTECQAQYLRVTGIESRAHHALLTDYLSRYRVWEQTVAAYRKAIQAAGLIPDPSIVSDRNIAEPPKARTPFILVDPTVIEREHTIQYYNPQYGVGKPYQIPDVSYIQTFQSPETAPNPYLHIGNMVSDDIPYRYAVHHSFDAPVTDTEIAEPKTEYPPTTPIPSRESIPRRVSIRLHPLGICPHARGVYHA